MLRIISLIISAIMAIPSGAIGQDGTIWFGNPDGSPLVFRVGSQESVPVWIQTNADVYVAALHIPLASDDRFITKRLGGQLFEPFVNDNPPEGFDKGWDSIAMRDPIPHDKMAGFTSQGILGFSDLYRKHNIHLHCEQPCKALEFEMLTAGDDSLKGQTFDVFIEGFDSRNYGISLSDTLGKVTFKFDVFYSQVNFLYPGDINADFNIDSDDLKLLESYLEGKAEIPWPETRGDCDNDGLINNNDLIYLKSILNGNDGRLK